MRRLGSAVALAVLLATACGKDSGSAAAAPPPQAPPSADPNAPTTTEPAPQPSPQPAPSPAPAPSPEPGAAPTTATPSAPAGPTIRWAASTPGVFWVGMDDAGARWSAADLRSTGRSVVRLERRDRDGELLGATELSYRGTGYRFTAAVTPGGEPLVAGASSCFGDPACLDSVDVGGATVRGSFVAKLGTDGGVRWVRPLDGFLVGADAGGGAALGWSRRDGSSTSYLVAKLDPAGNPVWRREITSLLALRLARTGDLLATGCYQGDRSLLAGIACHDGVVAARLAPAGAPRWTAHADGYWPVIDSTADGSEYAVARGGSPAFVMTALSPDGRVRFTRQLGAGLFANQRGDALVVAAAANGPVAVGGYGYFNDGSGTNPTRAVLLGFDAAGSATFTDTLAGVSQPSAMVYGADGELLLAFPGGSLDAPGGRVEGPMVVELTP